jgi:hypothetical protein
VVAVDLVLPVLALAQVVVEVVLVVVEVPVVGRRFFIAC